MSLRGSIPWVPGSLSLRTLLIPVCKECILGNRSGLIINHLPGVISPDQGLSFLPLPLRGPRLSPTCQCLLHAGEEGARSLPTAHVCGRHQ